MTTYVSYQCSVCRRTKDILQDNVRVQPNQCTITKGCRGLLYKIGETSIASPVDPVSGLTDWYPRGERVTTPTSAPSEQKVSLSCSDNGALTLAILMTDAAAIAYPTLRLQLRQRLSADVPFVEYVFNLIADEQIVSGKDSTGKNLRFDQNAINDGRVQVLVNGVTRSSGAGATDYQASPNVITFNTALDAGTVVVVSVFGIAPTTTQVLQFTANYSVINASSVGSWSNIRWVDEYDPQTGLLRSTNGERWWLYTCTALGDLSIASLLNIVSVNDQTDDAVIPGVLGEIEHVRFLIANPPHGSTDRYLDFYVSAEILTDPSGKMTSAVTTTTELFADREALTEIYPPFQLVSAENPANSSYVTPDAFSGAAVSQDVADERLTGTKIIGPV